MINWIKIEFEKDEFGDSNHWETIYNLVKRGMLLKMKDGEILLVGDINKSLGTNDEFTIDEEDVVAYSTDLIEFIEGKIK